MHKHRPSERSKGNPLQRRLRCEPLEQRRMLAITVDTLVDELDGSITDGDISLRDAIAAASAGETINFSVTGTINLNQSNGALFVNKSITINGPGADQLAIDAGHGTDGLPGTGDGRRVFQISLPFLTASVTIRGLTITGGDVAGSGGGISNSENLTLDSVEIRDNAATSDGGGVFHQTGNLTITSSTLSGNKGQAGGGLANFGSLSMTNSTVSGNSANYSGGGVAMYSGGTIRHTTITNNIADANDSGGGNGGQGGGIARFSGATVTVDHMIIAGNRTMTDNTGAAPDVAGTIASTFSMIGGDPLVAPLDLNGGSTRTHALLAGSPAINAGNVSAAPGVGTVPQFDQRGATFDRVADGRIDLGAFEVQPGSANSRPTNPGDVFLTAINEDAPMSASGTLVSDVVAASGAMDPDSNPLGIAITAADNTHGQWQYSLDDGGQWEAVSSVSVTTALNLAPSDRIRFVPNANFNSAIGATPFLNFKAWDQTSGAAGAMADTTLGDAYSVTTAAASQPVMAVNDAPSFALSTALITRGENAGLVTVTAFATNISPGPTTATDEAAQVLTFSVSVTGTTGNLAFATEPTIDASGELTFTALANTTGTATVEVVLQDDGNGAPPHNNTSNVQAFTIQIVPTVPGLLVDTLADESDGNHTIGDLSLREAIELANATAGPDSISFAPGLAGGTIELSLGELAITETVTIDASALASQIIIDANQQSRIFNFDTTSGDFTLNQLTLTGGKVVGNDPDDSTKSGGAIRFASAGELTIIGSNIHGNATSGDAAEGGGIFASGNVTLISSTIHGNSTAGIRATGGGIFAFGNVTVIKSTVSENSTAGVGALGGGILAIGDATLVESVVSQNHTTGSDTFAGGILAGHVTVNQSTISGNTTIGSNNHALGGGGLFAISGATVNNSTITGNRVLSVSSVGGGIQSYNGTIILMGSIVAGNSAGSDNHDLLSDSGGYSISHSLIGDNAGTLLAESHAPDANGNLIGSSAGGGVVDPLLGPLADNGGPTWTHALLPGSPAIDAGDPAFTSPPEYDQRGSGYARVAGGRIDMGAFEVQASTPSADFDGDGDVDGRDFLRWQRGNSPNPLSSSDLALWQEEYGAQEETSDLRFMIVDVGKLETGDRGNRRDAFQDSYFEEIGRAMEHSDDRWDPDRRDRPHGSPAMAPFGEMVARRGVKRVAR